MLLLGSGSGGLPVGSEGSVVSPVPPEVAPVVSSVPPEVASVVSLVESEDDGSAVSLVLSVGGSVV